MPIPSRFLPTVLLKITDTQRRKSCEHDDTSTSSTMTVERLSSTEQEESTTDDDATARRRRRVSFCIAKNESFSNNVMCEEDLRKLWYKSSDFKRFRAFTMHVANEIAKVEARSRGPFSYERVMTNTYMACIKATSEQGNVLTADEFKQLVRWAEVNTARCGMVKWSIRSIAHDRSYRKSLMRAMVMKIQNQCQDDFVSIDFNVADSCAAISRPLILFSRTLAEAQAVAVRNDHSLENVNETRLRL
jgi:hypothetical protein